MTTMASGSFDEAAPSRARLLAASLEKGPPRDVALGTMCSVTSVSLMNRSLFPLFDDVFTYARDISITVEALVLIALAIAAFWKPSIVRGRAFDTAAMVLCAGGSVCIAIGLALGPSLGVEPGAVQGTLLGMGGAQTARPLPTAALIAGACLTVTGRAWGSLVVNMSAVGLPLPQMIVCVLLGTLLAYPAQALCTLLPIQAGALLAVLVLPWAMMALCGERARALMDEIARSKPIADVSVTRPTTFLPLTHTLYVFQFVMFVGYGFALRFGEVGGAPTFGLAVVGATVAVLLGIAVARKGRMPFDTLCNVAVLTLLAGFMLVVINVEQGAYGANTLLAAGNALYGSLITCTMVALAGRNRVAALSILGWANGLAALGTTLGALVGTTGNAWLSNGGYQPVLYMVAMVVLVLMAYILFFLRGFSFEQTIGGIVPAPADERDEAIEPQIPSEAELFATSCTALAQEYGLTPREAQTFEMLARGRDREYIESALQVSRNTVKAHVKHVYAKLEIHSHLELIDLVMRQMRDQARR